MKSIKILLSILVVFTFFAFTSSAQKNVKTVYYYESGPLVGFELPGVPETVSGAYSGYWTIWNFKWQWRAKGVYVGDNTGTIYHTSAIENYNFLDWMPGSVETGRATILIKDEDGNVYYNNHYTSHATINANGEITSDVWNAHEYFF
ncbi:hypothetical protein [uncultured Draconibacterium sp.]|uniref:hypothetical protein n=1 Tax=uncultured Draconibacterium sp. TaxID=1573823 RepID=UPI0025F6CC51|nr:hypothetical protein [uncultured Draconibacterium sp.]